MNTLRDILRIAAVSEQEAFPSKVVASLRESHEYGGFSEDGTYYVPGGFVVTGACIPNRVCRRSRPKGLTDLRVPVFADVYITILAAWHIIYHPPLISARSLPARVRPDTFETKPKYHPGLSNSGAVPIFESNVGIAKH